MPRSSKYQVKMQRPIKRCAKSRALAISAREFWMRSIAGGRESRQLSLKRIDLAEKFTVDAVASVNLQADFARPEGPGFRGQPAAHLVELLKTLLCIEGKLIKWCSGHSATRTWGRRVAVVEPDLGGGDDPK